MLSRRNSSVALIVCLTCRLFGGENPPPILIAPSSRISPEAVVKVGLLEFNATGQAKQFEPHTELSARLESQDKSWIVKLKAEPGGIHSLSSGHYGVQTYAIALPPVPPGSYRLSLEEWPEAKAVSIEIGGGLYQTESVRPAIKSERDKPAISFLDRGFLERITPHKAVYFIYGPDAPAAKFQISFKYKLVDFGSVESDEIVPTLQFGYTQRSLWDIEATSSPFYDTSYMPELIFESLAPAKNNGAAFFNWLGYQAAFRHESNGRDGDVSRSLNNFSLRTMFSFGLTSEWKLFIAPELFTYVGGLSNNPSLKNYRGYGKLNVGIGLPKGISVQASYWAGKDFDHESVQLDLTIPLHGRWTNFEGYLLVQYFNGYGESLLNYEGKSDTIRAGISFVR